MQGHEMGIQPQFSKSTTPIYYILQLMSSAWWASYRLDDIPICRDGAIRTLISFTAGPSSPSADSNGFLTYLWGVRFLGSFGGMQILHITLHS